MAEKSIMEIIKERRSIRSFSDEEISDTVIRMILEAGIYAPSGKNRRPWRFAVIKNKSILREISMLTVVSRFIRNAGALILVYVKSDGKYPLEKDILSIGGCVQNILLSATGIGISTCVIGELFGKEMDIDKIVKIEHSDMGLVCGIALGKSEEESPTQETFSLKDHLLSEVIN
ncbi:MAG: nitroreductase [Clostridia bacterium]|nr:nitroreductase [Clostridia bacterium]